MRRLGSGTFRWCALRLLALALTCALGNLPAQAQMVRLGAPESIGPGRQVLGSPVITPTGAPPQSNEIDLDFRPQHGACDAPPGMYRPPVGWQIVPDGLIYRTYLAGQLEPRMAALYTFNTNSSVRYFDGAMGARVGLIRYGTYDVLRPEGFQLDAEGVAFPRLDFTNNWDLRSVDFQAGVPLTYARGPFEAKFGYSHISSHLGDEYMVAHQTFDRINYVRDAIILGLAYRYPQWMRLYFQADYAFNTDGGAKPWWLQFGIDLSSLEPTGFRGAPFAALNAWLRQENNWGGSLAAQLGWQWRGFGSGHLLRSGVQYFIGKSHQLQFYTLNESQLSLGLWYDF